MIQLVMILSLRFVQNRVNPGDFILPFCKINLCFFISLLVTLPSCQHFSGTETKNYPIHWWQAVSPKKAYHWEVTPDRVKAPMVILSKRNELGLLSNFASTPFVMDGRTYQSMEGLWQSMKYPEVEGDLRYEIQDWPYNRQQVTQLVAFKAKKAGDFGSMAMRSLGIDWVSYQGKRIVYRELKKGPFYRIIYKGMLAKFRQNKNVQKVLCATKGLSLWPDHNQGTSPPPAWQYHKIWMEIRAGHC